MYYCAVAIADSVALSNSPIYFIASECRPRTFGIHILFQSHRRKGTYRTPASSCSPPFTVDKCKQAAKGHFVSSYSHRHARTNLVVETFLLNPISVMNEREGDENDLVQPSTDQVHPSRQSR
jgi:hypothetical protein